MADDGWTGRAHSDIVGKLGELKADNAYNLGSAWTGIYTNVSDAGDKHDEARRQLATEGFWGGQGPAAALRVLTQRTTEFDDSETGTPALAGKMSNALAQDGEVLTSANHIAQAYPVPPDDTDADSKKKLLEAIRNEAQRLYTTPLEAKRPEFADSSGSPQSGPMPTGPVGSGGGPGNSGGAGGGAGHPSAPDGLRKPDTSPQDFAPGDGQQAGQGQGQGAGQGQGGGSGSGGGAPSGGSGSGGSGSGLGSGSKDPVSGLPLGGTTAAGFSPSATGTGAGAGTGGGGLGGLRGGLGSVPVPPGGGGTGVNPAAMGAAGVRGAGMGPMGMMGAGAHGAHGKGEDEGEHPIPNILINYDNTDEFFGDLPSASPGVIGDWTEQEKAQKAAKEKEIRRYKALGWDVEFE